MNDRFVLFSGSASSSCPDERLDQAIQFLGCFVPQVLQAGGEFVVLLGDEDRTKGDDGKPRIFDWEILRSVERYVESTTGGVRPYARVVISDNAWVDKMSAGNRRTFSNLQQRGALKVERIRREEYAGGTYRRVECELADALLALGGGKGTYIVGREMLELGKPVLPLDLDIGASSEDGEGALLLHRELQADPSLFFPATHDRVMDQIEAVSFQANPIDSVARRTVEMLNREMSSSARAGTSLVKRGFNLLETAAKRFLAFIGVLRAWEFLRQMFSLG